MLVQSNHDLTNESDRSEATSLIPKMDYARPEHPAIAAAGLAVAILMRCHWPVITTSLSASMLTQVPCGLTYLTDSPTAISRQQTSNRR
jgi:hypothetical protein